MLNSIRINLPTEEIRAYCDQQPIQRLAIFGSALRDDFTPESDVDLLVEYTPGTPVTLLDMAQQQIDLTSILQRKVDLRTRYELSPYFRQQVIDIAMVIYERAK
jgi:uncharacterized protein